MAEFISTYTAKVNFLALCTPILAYAGIYTGKNLETLKKTGWKFLILALFVMLGTYLGSAIIAQIIFKNVRSNISLTKKDRCKTKFSTVFFIEFLNI